MRCLRHKGCLIIEISIILSRKYNNAFTIQSNPFPCALAMKTHILSAPPFVCEEKYDSKKRREHSVNSPNLYRQHKRAPMAGNI